eukprot:6185972-Pleurochrysis_carterae.AAC.1
MISGIIPEWQEADDKDKKKTIATMRSWTGEMMNRAGIQMKMWIERKNEHKANVQRRWDNRGRMNSAFKRWKRIIGGGKSEWNGREDNRDGEGEKEKIYGMKCWERVRAIPRIHTQVKQFLQMGIG